VGHCDPCLQCGANFVATAFEGKAHSLTAVDICAFFEAKFDLLFILVGDNTRKEECDTLLSLLKRYIHLD
jgi:hypothetical protein